jgi:hypothetical protein
MTGYAGAAVVVLHVDPFRLGFLGVLLLYEQFHGVDPLVLDNLFTLAVVGATQEVVRVPAVDDSHDCPSFEDK